MFYTEYNPLHTLFLHLGQKFVQHHHLAAVHHKVEVSCVGGSGLSTVEQVRVVAALPQLHEDVEQAHLVHLTRRVQDVDILHQNLCVPDVYDCTTSVSEFKSVLSGTNGCRTE